MTEGSVFGQPARESGQSPANNPQLDNAETLIDEDLRGDPLDTGYSPPDRDPGTDRWGTTAQEQRAGETLDERLSQELPDVTAGLDSAGDPDTGGELAEPRAGRLVAPDEGAHLDTEGDAIAADVGIDGGAASAEEAAVHVVDDRDLDGLNGSVSSEVLTAEPRAALSADEVAS